MQPKLIHAIVGLLMPILLCVHGATLAQEPVPNAPSQAVPPAQPAPVQRHPHPKKPPAAATSPQPKVAPAAAPPISAPAADSGDSGMPFLLWVGIAVALIWLFGWLKAQGRKARAQELLTEAQKWLEKLKTTGKITVPNTGSIIIPKGDNAVLGEATTLFELHADSTRHYLGTRVNIGNMPIYLGSSSSVSKKVLKATSSGTLALTDKGLIFVGSARTVHLKASDIVGVEPTIDSIVVNSGTHVKPLIFGVRNPFTWSAAIKLVASGNLTGA